MKIDKINFHIGLKYMDLANYFFLKLIGNFKEMSKILD